MKAIDLNCDMGETPGNMPHSPDEALLDYVSSANIACGFHAGDPDRMARTVNAAIKKGVAIGAHPGLADLAGFGRNEISISPTAVYQITIYQIGALWGFVKAAGGKLNHVKAHGALYNMAARDVSLAEALVDAVHDIDPQLTLYALAGSEMVYAARRKGVRVLSEGFVDRTYQDDGSLTPRTDPRALINDTATTTAQALMIAQQQQVVSANHQIIPLKVQTLCIHGDSERALDITRAIHSALTQSAIQIKTHQQ